MTTLAVAATMTTTPTLGTCVLQLPLRTPDAVAKQATALQLLSEGRFVLGLGVGSHEPEYRRAGADFSRRGRSMDEGLAALRRAWRMPDTAGRAETGDRAGDDYVQAPPSARVPLWFGGSSSAARRRAAAEGDGWVPLFLAPDEYREALEALRLESAHAGRARDAVEAAVVVFACVGDDAEAPRQGAAWLSQLYRLPPKAFHRHLVAGSPDACAASLQRYADAGARHIIVMVAASPAVEHFALLRAAFTGRPERSLAGVTA